MATATYRSYRVEVWRGLDRWLWQVWRNGWPHTAVYRSPVAATADEALALAAAFVDRGFAA